MKEREINKFILETLKNVSSSIKERVSYFLVIASNDDSEFIIFNDEQESLTLNKSYGLRFEDGKSIVNISGLTVCYRGNDSFTKHFDVKSKMYKQITSWITNNSDLFIRELGS